VYSGKSGHLGPGGSGLVGRLARSRKPDRKSLERAEVRKVIQIASPDPAGGSYIQSDAQRSHLPNAGSHDMNAETNVLRLARGPTANPAPANLSPFDAMLPAYVRWGEQMSRSIAENVLDRCIPRAEAQVLDVCAGTGALAVAAAERGHAVQGIVKTSPMRSPSR
jgi:2-polyprenyl-3-methyl-5-hydroxy-6-metoxy-1,4-benzoquinol methylase